MFPLRIMTFLLILPSIARAQVDLHAHLVMKPGMGPALRGDFEGAPLSTSWESRWSTKATRVSLEQSGAPRLSVIALYGHPWLSRPEFPGWESNVSRALEEEYRLLRAFVDRPESNWILARNAQEARQALRGGKRVLVLSIEGAYGALRTPDDLNRWIERGLSLLTPFHLTEDRFGGVALMRPWAAVFNTPVSFLTSLWRSGGSCLRDLCRSPSGLTEEGKLWIQKLIANKIWIDFAHANDLQVEGILPLLKAAALPLLVTHTALREHFPAERGLSPEITQAIRKGQDGLIGLIPSEDMIRSPGSQESCSGGLSRFREEIQSLMSLIGEHRVTLGSDANAPLRGLSPPCESPEWREGYAQYGKISELTAYLHPRSDQWNQAVLEHFLDLWEKVRPSPNANAPIPHGSTPRIRRGNPR